MAINITKNNFIVIKILLEEKYISKSTFKNKKLLSALLACNSISISEERPVKIYLNDEKALLGVIKANGYNVTSLRDIEHFINQEEIPKSRDDVANDYSDTKRVESKSFNGLMIAVLDKLEVTFNNKKEYLYPNIQATGLFLHYSSKLELLDDVIVVGVENPQVVWQIKKYKHLFAENKKYLFLSISEYKTNYQYKWLETFKGEYIHFGDFDLAGINIYLNTIIPRLKKCKKHSFLIPENIYKIIKEKDYKKDYSHQTKYENIESKDDFILQELIDFIKTNKITLEQEMLSV
ncbi:hypothetical protein KO488_09580 [Poseidonibacter lekithochrous]|uniref:DUF7281 domain-containing protein n=1 Tax=Poseidonibacter TaxID=2321187 RepID=UPI001C09640C|nr:MULTISPECIES: hypothetical protein [Poseidonibacter]MBU3015006.1 hypothetical protein [Poseidonibacter lekithochrous]MDO6828303.1 hypothetical protein [Poseidonibacter sp. 1_MG-2023]